MVPVSIQETTSGKQCGIEMFKNLYKSPIPGNGKNEEIIFATVLVNVHIFSLGY